MLIMKSSSRNRLAGAGTVLSLMPTDAVVADIKPFYCPEKSVHDALRRDWQRIGQDLERALGNHGAKAAAD